MDHELQKFLTELSLRTNALEHKTATLEEENSWLRAITYTVLLVAGFCLGIVAVLGLCGG